MVSAMRLLCLFECYQEGQTGGCRHGCARRSTARQRLAYSKVHFNLAERVGFEIGPPANPLNLNVKIAFRSISMRV